MSGDPSLYLLWLQNPAYRDILCDGLLVLHIAVLFPSARKLQYFVNHNDTIGELDDLLAEKAYIQNSKPASLQTA